MFDMILLGAVGLAIIMGLVAIGSLKSKIKKRKVARHQMSISNTSISSIEISEKSLKKMEEEKVKSKYIADCLKHLVCPVCSERLERSIKRNNTVIYVEKHYCAKCNFYNNRFVT